MWQSNNSDPLFGKRFTLEFQYTLRTITSGIIISLCKVENPFLDGASPFLVL